MCTSVSYDLKCFTSFYLLSTLHVADVFNVNVQTVGFITSIPILGGIIGIIGSAVLADYLRSTKKFHINTVRVNFNLIHKYSMVIFFL